MFKVLVAASIAMLLCCCAAAWAGPVDVTKAQTLVAPAPVNPLPAQLVERVPPPEGDDASLAAASVNGLVPVYFAPTYTAGVAGTISADPAPLEPGVLPAVIPLPSPLYVGGAVVVFAMAFRRALIRSI